MRASITIEQPSWEIEDQKYYYVGKLIEAVVRAWQSKSLISLMILHIEELSVDYVPIIEAATQIDKIGLQFSVHESTDEQRDKLIPFKNKLTLDQISTVGWLFYSLSHRKPFFNYCAHDNNVGDDDAHRLYALFNPEVWCATVSVICERDEYRQGKNEHQRQLALDFGNKLVSKGYDVRVFDPAGQDTIGGGCGQLWFVQDWMKNNPDKARPTVGNGLPVIHVPTESSSCDSCETTSTKKPCCS